MRLTVLSKCSSMLVSFSSGRFLLHSQLVDGDVFRKEHWAIFLQGKSVMRQPGTFLGLWLGRVFGGRNLAVSCRQRVHCHLMEGVDGGPNRGTHMWAAREKFTKGRWFSFSKSPRQVDQEWTGDWNRFLHFTQRECFFFPVDSFYDIPSIPPPPPQKKRLLCSTHLKVEKYDMRWYLGS